MKRDWLTIVLLGLIVAAAYDVYKLKEDKRSAALLAAASGRVAIAEVVPGEWDAVVVVTPYTSEQEMRAVGIPATRLRDTSITYLDDRVLLAFFEGDTFTKYSYMQRVSGIPHTTRFTREEAVLHKNNPSQK
ncbi:hypothetical protein CH76_09980 [Lysinibacillus sp. BF-4]|uniref:hypothetical protein n=1 Tax=Lysinibacillus sp. BF-4 TaxID=1473546 RepID=UPI00050360CB|nr:hypothetical protein [Lysinibacillus sp. BF-4]KFL42881.1 hypothetical protein CH76_09980 [Lysinibacillus sp. BF-4]